MAAATRTPAQTTGRMALKDVRKGKRQAPDRILLVGVEGVGKSSFAADAPDPIFIAAEDGIRHLDVSSFPEPENFAEIIESVRTLTADTHEYKTLVLDTLDWIEPLIWGDVCQRHGWENIESPGYGKGFNVALDEWRKLIAALEKLRASKGMEIILLAHAAIRNFSNPAGADFSRYECKLHRGAAALAREWTDSNLFATYEEFATKKQGELKVKGVSTGRRVVHTQRTAAWDAKNRYSLPPELPLSYSDYAAARELGQTASPDKLRAEAIKLLDELSPPTAKRTEILTSIEKATGNATVLAKCVDRLKTLVMEKEAA